MPVFTEALAEKELRSANMHFQAEIQHYETLPHLEVYFSLKFPVKALVEAISKALEIYSAELLPAIEVRDAGVYIRLWATYTLETQLGCSAREAAHEWNSMIERVDHPLTAVLSWNLQDAIGPTVGSGETQYSRTKRIIRQRVNTFDNAFQ